MRIILERSKCIGCASCQSVCPDFFETGEDNLINLKGSKQTRLHRYAKHCGQEGEIFELEIKNDVPNSLKEAVDICPLKIIKFVE